MKACLALVAPGLGCVPWAVNSELFTPEVSAVGAGSSKLFTIGVSVLLSANFYDLRQCIHQYKDV